MSSNQHMESLLLLNNEYIMELKGIDFNITALKSQLDKNRRKELNLGDRAGVVNFYGLHGKLLFQHFTMASYN